MNDDVLILVPQLVDKAGRIVYNIHGWPEGRKTLGTVSQTRVLGQIRMSRNTDDDADEVAFVEWSNGLFGEE